jgi:hypothetical protein
MLPVDLIHAIARYLALPELKLLMRTCRPVRAELLADRALTEACMRHYGTRLRTYACLYWITVRDPGEGAQILSNLAICADGTGHILVKHDEDPAAVFAEHRRVHNLGELASYTLGITFGTLRLPFAVYTRTRNGHVMNMDSDNQTGWYLLDAGDKVDVAFHHGAGGRAGWMQSNTDSIYDHLRGLARPTPWLRNRRFKGWV